MSTLTTSVPPLTARTVYSNIAIQDGTQLSHENRVAILRLDDRELCELHQTILTGSIDYPSQAFRNHEALQFVGSEMAARFVQRVTAA